jgi:uncharacterized membrane protein YagU involved in acid resistance
MGARRATLIGATAVGVLDLGWAVGWALFRGRSPSRALQAIASGLVGARAFELGGFGIALGVLLHAVVANTVAAVYVRAARRFPSLVERPLPSGAAYGLVVYLVMTRLVVPLSAAPWSFGWAPVELAGGVAAHLLCVGWPIAWVARRELGRSASS